jgi:hypothetical protein
MARIADLNFQNVLAYQLKIIMRLEDARRDDRLPSDVSGLLYFSCFLFNCWTKLGRWNGCGGGDRGELQFSSNLRNWEGNYCTTFIGLWAA